MWVYGKGNHASEHCAATTVIMLPGTFKKPLEPVLSQVNNSGREVAFIQTNFPAS